MRNDGHRSGAGGELVPRPSRGSNGILPNSFKAISGYLKLVSSGASTVASTVRSAASAASAMMERDSESCHDQVCWAGFDKLELERGTSRQILLLCFSYGFQIWDVEDADNVRNLVSRHDGAVSFMQMAPKPMVSHNQAGDDKFAESRPLLIICADASFPGSANFHELSGASYNGSIQHTQGQVNGSSMPTVVWFYSLKSQSYEHHLTFRSVVHLVRCSSRVVAVLLSAQIHCFNAATLEGAYVIRTNPVATGCYGSGNTGFGPFALGPRWMAYSGSQVPTSSSGRVSPQQLTPSASFPANGSLVAHLAKESSRQLAAGIATLGDIGYKKLSRYYSELLPDGNSSQSGAARLKVHGSPNGHSPDPDSVGMVIVRDIVNRAVIAQFGAHKSPILSLCFDPSGILLVTASVQGHNINVFHIMPGSSDSASGPSYVHLYRLQRGLTNAVIQDISFSSDSQWIMISSSRGTSHLFAISPTGQSIDAYVNPRNSGTRSISKSSLHGSALGVQVLTEQIMSNSASPITLNAVSRIRNGSRIMNSLSGAIASVFHNCKGNACYEDASGMKKKYYLLVFSPSGSVIQYALHTRPSVDGVEAYESNLESDARIIVEAIQKWNICHKQNQIEREDIINMYNNDSGFRDNSKIYPDKMDRENNMSLDAICKVAREKLDTKEKSNHKFISEAEIRVQKKQNTLWAKLEQIHLYSMPTDAFIREESGEPGEIEIENVPVRMLESRSRGLVPVIDFYQTPRLQQGSENIGQHRHHGSDVSDDVKLGGISSSSSIISTDGGGMIVNESNESPEEKGHDGLQSLPETGNSNANANDGKRIMSETLYTNEDYLGESQLRSVNNIDDGLVEKFAEGFKFD